MLAAFAALRGRLTDNEFMRLLGSAEYYGRVVRLAGLLLAGDTAVADDVARGSLATSMITADPRVPAGGNARMGANASAVVEGRLPAKPGLMDAISQTIRPVCATHGFGRELVQSTNDKAELKIVAAIRDMQASA